MLVVYLSAPGELNLVHHAQFINRLMWRIQHEMETSCVICLVSLWKQGCEASLCHPAWESEGGCWGSHRRRFTHSLHNHAWPGLFLHLLLFRLSCIFYAAPAKSLHGEKPIIFSMFSSLHQLAALIDDSAGVIATNTAAIQLATARNKPRLVL